LLAAVLFGLSAPLAKGLLRDAAPQLLAGLLYLGSGSGLLAVWLVRRGRAAGRAEAPLGRRDVPWLAGAIAAGGVLGPLLLMLGLARTPASSASLLLNFEGVLTALLAWFVFRENVDRRSAASRWGCSPLSPAARSSRGRGARRSAASPGRSPSSARARAGRSTTT
jgi:drug/metabolite transporter (DMT)-like permease